MKKLKVGYLNVTAEGIRNNLTEIAQTLHPEVYRDFSESSFGSLITDTQSYLGEMLYFYNLYNANETLPNSAIEFENILRGVKNKGFRYKGVGSIYGTQDFYVVVPSDTFGNGPKSSLIPVLKASDTIVGQPNGEIYTLVEDIDFSNPKNEVLVAEFNESTGLPSSFAIKASGIVRSGQQNLEVVEVGSFVPFRKITIDVDNFIGIETIIDENGNAYYEVDSLAQSYIFKWLANYSKVNFEDPTNLLEVISVDRKFTVDYDGETATITFGGSPVSQSASDNLNPSKVAVNAHGRSYISDLSLNPYDLTQTGTMGVGPENTELDIVYRVNNSDNPNAAVGEVNQVLGGRMTFKDELAIAASDVLSVESSLETENREPFNGNIILDLPEELRQRARGASLWKTACVTNRDYEFAAYSMPNNFGMIKRSKALLDKDTLRDNINLFVISEDKDGYLTITSETTKNNLKKWLSIYKSSGDSVDILDASIVNIGIEFSIVPDGVDPDIALIASLEALKDAFGEPKDIGETIKINDIYKVLRDVSEVLDADDVKFTLKKGENYSSVIYNLDKNYKNGKLTLPENHIFEIKFPDIDIVGYTKK